MRVDKEGGQNMVMMDMRYMWSAMDSPWWERPACCQPSRLVDLSRERRWKKGIGVDVFSRGGLGRDERTVRIRINWLVSLVGAG